MRYVFGDYCLDTQRYELHNALMPLDEQARILDHLHAAEALAERLTIPSGSDRSPAVCASILWAMGRV